MVTARSAPADAVFESAVAAWQMGTPRDIRGANGLRIVGKASLGEPLAGDDLRDSIASGNDGLVARLDGHMEDCDNAVRKVNAVESDDQNPLPRRRSPGGLDILICRFRGWTRFDTHVEGI